MCSSRQHDTHANKISRLLFSGAAAFVVIVDAVGVFFASIGARLSLEPVTEIRFPLNCLYAGGCWPKLEPTFSVTFSLAACF